MTRRPAVSTTCIALSRSRGAQSPTQGRSKTASWPSRTKEACPGHKCECLPSRRPNCNQAPGTGSIPRKAPSCLSPWRPMKHSRKRDPSKSLPAASQELTKGARQQRTPNRRSERLGERTRGVATLPSRRFLGKDMGYKPLKIKYFHGGIIRKSAPRLAEITIRKSQKTIW
jgi:hypothetical protein